MPPLNITNFTSSLPLDTPNPFFCLPMTKYLVEPAVHSLGIHNTLCDVDDMGSFQFIALMLFELVLFRYTVARVIVKFFRYLRRRRAIWRDPDLTQEELWSIAQDGQEEKRQIEKGVDRVNHTAAG